ncbi:hypothetical protein DPMN_148260 [Dreissena polymorpha]|uniref:Uncharacterized protein n=1 Tax=Dreissena polymorpha TaxID=45954 RepID=A0A9D4J460_DREPO|nr:hypothetical protein DPMN_148260 [Dreissena polymorpha]
MSYSQQPTTDLNGGGSPCRCFSFSPYTQTSQGIDDDGDDDDESLYGPPPCTYMYQL